MALSVGTRLGPYEVTAVLGAGGMGEVYRARDTRLGRDIALKVLPEAFARDASRLARFEREARTVASLNHPNIVTLHSIEDAAGVRFITMELVDGESLDRRIPPGGLPMAPVIEIGLALADALAAAHGQHVIHRDLKPGNVMLTREGRVKLLDFGLAKPAPGTGDVTTAIAASTTAPASATGQVVGTVPYMAPEQVRGGDVDERADLFALGVLLYETTTGRRPFAGATVADVISAILRDAPAPVSSVRPDAPPALARLIGRCLGKHPDTRPQSAAEVRQELGAIQRELQAGPASGAPHAASRVAPSVAVLPFTDRGRSGDDDYFADGITEDVIAQLGKVRTLKVISRSSVMPFKNRDVSLPEIAASLDVSSVLAGSVRRAGDRVRIVASLIDAASGQHLWAETFDRQMTDIFAIQSEVALRIATALKAELAPGESARIRHEPTRDVEAYEYYLRGRHALDRHTTEQTFRSVEHFSRAIERDPEFAAAYVGLAMAQTELGETGRLDRSQSRARAMSAALRAVALDPELGDAHSVLAYARMVYEFDWNAAEAGFTRAIELSPGNADAFDLYGRLCGALGRFDEAVQLHRRASELDPFTHLSDLATSYLRAGRPAEAERAAREALGREPNHARLSATLGWALFAQGRAEEGLASLERAAALAPADTTWLAQHGQALAMCGREAEARAILQALDDPSRPIPSSPYHRAYVCVGLGELERAMDFLEHAFESGSGAVYGIKGSFLLAPLREHPRFVALLKKMRLA